MAAFALPEHFDEDPEVLREDLETMLKGLDAWMDLLSGDDFSVKYDITLYLLDKGDIDYDYKARVIYSPDLEDAMKNSLRFNQTEANIKVLLTPERPPDIQELRLKNTEKRTAGEAFPGKQSCS